MNKTLCFSSENLVININNQRRDNVIKWLFSLSVEERLHQVLIVGNYFSTMILKAFKKSRSGRIMLKYIGNQFAFTNCIYEKVSEEEKYLEALFLNEIRFFSVEKPYDAITFSISFLGDEKMFMNFMDKITGNQFLREMKSVHKNKSTGRYECEFPSWFDINKMHSLPKILVAYFELNITIKHYLYENKISENNEKLDLLFSKRKVIFSVLENKEKAHEFFKETPLCLAR